MIESIQEGSKVIIKPEKNIVASAEEELKEKISQAMDAGAQEITFDMAAAEMIDSIGIGILIAAHNELQKKGEKLELINVCANITKLLKGMRLDTHFKM